MVGQRFEICLDTDKSIEVGVTIGVIEDPRQVLGTTPNQHDQFWSKGLITFEESSHIPPIDLCHFALVLHNYERSELARFLMANWYLPLMLTHLSLLATKFCIILIPPATALLGEHASIYWAVFEKPPAIWVCTSILEPTISIDVNDFRRIESPFGEERRAEEFSLKGYLSADL